MTFMENVPGLNMDFTATTPLAPEVIEEMVRVMAMVPGNPSSPHRLGLRAAEIVEQAREAILKESGLSDTHRLIFTSGGSEGNSMVMHALPASPDNTNLVTTPFEHNSIRVFLPRMESAGADVREIQPDQSGNIVPEKVLESVDRNTRLVSIMAVNNETGFIFNIPEIAKAIRRHFPQTRIHTDYVQGFMKIPMVLDDVDFVSLSAHKIHGPKGTGALIIRKELSLPFIIGGSHEYGLRGGTQNVPGIAGFGEAVRLLKGKVSDNLQEVSLLRSSFLKVISEKLNRAMAVEGSDNSPYILGLTVPGIKSEVVVRMLSKKGIFISAGSACSSKSRNHNRTAQALGLNPDEYLRISFSPWLAMEEVETAANTIAATCNEFLQLMGNGPARLRG